jgi:predicted esterase
MEDKTESNDKKNQNENDKIIKDESKKTKIIQDEEINGNSKKNIIIITIIILIISVTLKIVLFKKQEKDEIQILPPLIFNSTSGNHTHTIIFMPGFSNQPEDFRNTFVNKIQFSKKKDTTIIILRSPLTYVTAIKSKHYSWFDAYKTHLDDFSSINFEDLKKSAKVLEQVVNNEVNILNGDYSKIILGGHSQGAMISLNQAYTSNKIYGGVYAFSGILPPGDISDDKRKMKAWIGYGDKDDVISLSFINKTLSRIAHFEGVEIHVYPNHKHYIKTIEAKDAAKFLDKIIK